LGAGLDFVQWDDHVFEENNVLFSERDRESTDDRSEDVEQLSCSVELVRLVDEGVKAFVNGFSDHLSSRDELSYRLLKIDIYYLGVELVENVLKVVSLNRLLRVEELEELLHELGSHVDF
jgi:hypothetical protein